MSRVAKLNERKPVCVHILLNQLSDMEKVKECTGKSRTDSIKEALALWLSTMRREGVL